MHTFNDTGIFTGYIKQLLKEFNLPKVKVYTKKYQDYFDTYGVEHPEVLETLLEENTKFPSIVRYVPYIKENKLQEYINGEWQIVGFRDHNRMKHEHNYTYGSKLLNYTKNLQLKNNIYDSYTHEYLGDYLRFQRDYLNINLMSLYNCFSNRTCDKLDLSWEVIDRANLDEDSVAAKKYITCSFKSSDSNYKIYMMPIKLFQKYTIAIDSSGPIELCCGIYGQYQDKRDKFKSLPKITYKKISGSQFSKPFIYDKLNAEYLKDELADVVLMETAQNEADLKLFIKLPKNNTSTIVILEGDYLNWNDRGYVKASATGLSIDYDDLPDAYGNIYDINKTKPTALSQTYLKTETGTVYESTPITVGNTISYRWQRTENLWNRITNETNLTGNKPKSHKIYVDETDWLSDDKKEKYAKMPDGLLKEYFRQFRLSTLKTDLDRNTIYYNKKLKQVLINPIENWDFFINYSVINVDLITDENDIALRSPLQLLHLNTGKQHPFADRLVEYLAENVIIDSENEIYNNIKRVQKVLMLNKAKNNYKPVVNGVWDYKMSKILYEHMTTKNVPSESKHDLLGYVDKDVEKHYSATKFIIDPYTKQTKKVDVSILNTELDEEGN